MALGAGAALATTDAVAQTATATRGQAEASMVLSGTIDIRADGNVEGFSLANQKRVDPGIAAFLSRTIGKWRFEPVMHEGRAVPARTPVSVRLVARSLSADETEIRLRSASFQIYDDQATDSVRKLRMAAPTFPAEALEMNGGGEVVLLVKVDRNGAAVDVAAEQVNLQFYGSTNDMRKMSDVLTRSASRAARRWTFLVPTSGDYVDASFWTVRVPVNFAYSLQEERYGRWQAYMPGPRQKAAWLAEGSDDGLASDALADGGVYMVGVDKGPRLLTPLQEG